MAKQISVENLLDELDIKRQTSEAVSSPDLVDMFIIREERHQHSPWYELIFDNQ